MWRLLPDSWLWFCPCSSMARVMTCSYVVPVHRQGQWWPIVFSLYEGGLASVTLGYQIGHAIFVDVVHWYMWPVFVMILILCFFICHFIKYFDSIVLVTWLFLYSSIRSILLLHILRHCMVVWEYCSSLAQVVLDTYVVPRHWHDQWRPIVLSYERANVTIYITIWKCRCSSVFHRLPSILSDCRYCRWKCKTSTVLMQNNLWYIMVIWSC